MGTLGFRSVARQHPPNNDMLRTTIVALLAVVFCVENAASQVSQDVEFRLFCLATVDQDHLKISPEAMGDFDYKSTYNYVFLLHAEDDNGFDNFWYWRTIQKFMMRPNYVVIAVGYGKAFNDSSAKPEEKIAALGQRIGEMLVALKKKSISPDIIELVGHSIGAHVAGAASEYLNTNAQQTVRRIFGLDPCVIAADNKGNLKKSNAKQVVIIHTSKNCIQNPIGHVDFYPDGGFNHTECEQLLDYNDHQMAAYYFRCSIQLDCRMYGRICDSIESVAAGKCSDNPFALFGYNVDMNCQPGTYYLYTFCREMQNSRGKF